jgi:hypothetical protein
MQMTATSEALPVKNLPSLPEFDPAVPLVIRPQRRVLVRKMVVMVLLLVLFGVLPTLLAQFTQPGAAPRNYLPGFGLLCGMLGLHLLFLSRALFVSLNRHAEIRLRETGLDIALDGTVRRLEWNEIRAVDFGDIHLFVRTAGETLEIPFIAAADQRLIFRLHYRHTGLTPDAGRFLQPRH